MPRGFDPVRSLPEARLHCIKAILQEITYGKVSGDPVIKDFGPTPGDRPGTLKTGPKIEELN
jgi:hypothetical protein